MWDRMGWDGIVKKIKIKKNLSQKYGAMKIKVKIHKRQPEPAVSQMYQLTQIK